MRPYNDEKKLLKCIWPQSVLLKIEQRFPEFGLKVTTNLASILYCGAVIARITHSIAIAILLQ